jgi:hypothetical protein
MTTTQTEEVGDEARFQRYSMSWEDVIGVFPYGLPVSLRRGSWRWFRSSNIVDLEQWRRNRQEQERQLG